MNQVRVGFSFVYIVLGIAIIVRVLHYGLHLAIFGGMVLGLVMIALGVYRITFY
ncbi:MAG: hypothetical protein JOZ59_04665, partial [Candidatus Eremiobacteraeota bacterium]|nr:hypothetical protein [Candidatus Eremiobacteraeota bacterium]